jgi:hypothetical protein
MSINCDDRVSHHLLCDRTDKILRYITSILHFVVNIFINPLSYKKFGTLCLLTFVSCIQHKHFTFQGKKTENPEVNVKPNGIEKKSGDFPPEKLLKFDIFFILKEFL